MHFCNMEKSFDILLLFGEKSEFLKVIESIIEIKPNALLIFGRFNFLYTRNYLYKNDHIKYYDCII